MAVIAKFDCRVFCHINSLEDKISNTAATIQPNSFWFWENIYIYLYFRSLFLTPLFVLETNDFNSNFTVKTLYANSVGCLKEESLCVTPVSQSNYFPR